MVKVALDVLPVVPGGPGEGAGAAVLGDGALGGKLPLDLLVDADGAAAVDEGGAGAGGRGDAARGDGGGPAVRVGDVDGGHELLRLGLGAPGVGGRVRRQHVVAAVELGGPAGHLGHGEGVVGRRGVVHLGPGVALVRRGPDDGAGAALVEQRRGDGCRVDVLRPAVVRVADAGPARAPGLGGAAGPRRADAEVVVDVGVEHRQRCAARR